MSFFDYSVAPFRRKSNNLNLDPQSKIWPVSWSIGKHQSYSTVYTSLDLACILWTLLLIPMFVTPQFFSVSWKIQAGLWSALSLVGLVAMVRLTQDWMKIKGVSWALGCWVILILVGLLLTDLGIFLAWGGVLANLCSLWLGLNALGYGFTGLVVHSRAIIAIGFVHLGAILVLPYVGVWQFLFTGCVMEFCLIVLAELRWDILPLYIKK
jgi:hypothetical protein